MGRLNQELSAQPHFQRLLLDMEEADRAGIGLDLRQLPER